MMHEKNSVNLDERIMLEKFEGEPAPDTLVERMYILNGKVEKIEYYEEGNLIKEERLDGNY